MRELVPVRVQMDIEDVSCADMLGLHRYTLPDLLVKMTYVAVEAECLILLACTVMSSSFN